MVDDLRGRVLLAGAGGEPAPDPARRGVDAQLIELLQRKLSRIVDPVLQKLVATSLIGALTGLFTAYLNGRLGATRKQLSTTASTCCSAPLPPTHRTASGENPNTHPSRAAQLRTTGVTTHTGARRMPASCPAAGSSTCRGPN